MPKDGGEKISNRAAAQIHKEEGMTAQKSADTSAQRASSATSALTTAARERKPWRKKTAVDVVLSQIDRAREDVARKEEEFKTAKRQLEKLEAARKVLEST